MHRPRRISLRFRDVRQTAAVPVARCRKTRRESFIAPPNPGLTADPQTAVLLGSSAHARDFITHTPMETVVGMAANPFGAHELGSDMARPYVTVLCGACTKSKSIAKKICGTGTPHRSARLARWIIQGQCVDNRGCFRSLFVSSRGTADETYSLRAKCRELKERIDGCKHQPPNLAEEPT
jgi:hypothetical protein